MEKRKRKEEIKAVRGGEGRRQRRLWKMRRTSKMRTLRRRRKKEEVKIEDDKKEFERNK